MEADIGADVGGGRQVREYLAVLRRRKWLIAAIAIPGALVALVVALALPPTYRSTATILVQEQEVPPELVRSTITSFADERIQVISQQVMTRSVLLDLVNRFGLYQELRGKTSSDVIVDRMRRDIRLQTITADMSDRNSGRRVNATIAFTISYDAPEPARAQQVVNELVTLYLAENVKARQQSVAETTAFLAQEADRLARQIQGIEAKLAEFKRRNVGRLPESSSINVQLAERTEAELQRVEREISLLQDRKLSLEGQLARVKATLPASSAAPVADSSASRPRPAEERLRTLQAQYASATAIYGADHPDVRRLQREIAALRAETGTAVGGDPAEQRRQLEGELAQLRQRYGDEHPDVQRLRRTIAAFPPSGAGTSTATTRPANRAGVPEAEEGLENPVYTMLSSQLESVERELKQLLALRDDLRARQRTYDARLLQIPEVEREYRELTRDYGNAQTRYQEIKTKQLQAEGALELEKDHKAERFNLGEAANLPQSPHTPNRPRIALLGVLASLGAGIGLAWLREVFDTSVKGPLELARIASAPILTAIPYIDTRGELVGRRRRAAAIGLLIVVLCGAFFYGVHTYVKPLPALVRTAPSLLELR